MIFIVANYGGYGGLEGSLGSPQTTRHFLEQRMAIGMQAGPCMVSLYMWLGNMVGAAGRHFRSHHSKSIGFKSKNNS